MQIHCVSNSLFSRVALGAALFFAHTSITAALPLCPSDAAATYDRCLGRYVLPSGTWAVGEWYEDELNGRGVRKSNDGTTYVGDFLNAQADGEGIYLSTDGDIYVGDVEQEEFSGKGLHIFSDQNLYVGEYVSGLPHGTIFLSNADGTIRQSQFREGVMSGPSIVYMSTAMLVVEKINGSPFGPAKALEYEGPTYYGLMRTEIRQTALLNTLMERSRMTMKVALSVTRRRTIEP